MLGIVDVGVLIAGPTMLGKDVAAHLEHVAPGLTDSVGPDLFLADPPFLRSIWICGDTDRPWAMPVSLDLDDPVGAPISDALLTAEEEAVTAADLTTVGVYLGFERTPQRRRARR